MRLVSVGMDNDDTNVESEDDRSCAWKPEDGVVLEWWGRAEGIDEFIVLKSDQ